MKTSNDPRGFIVLQTTLTVESLWLDISIAHFCIFLGFDLSRSIKMQKKELYQYLAILTSRSVNNAYISKVKNSHL